MAAKSNTKEKKDTARVLFDCTPEEKTKLERIVAFQNKKNKKKDKFEKSTNKSVLLRFIFKEEKKIPKDFDPCK